MDIVVMDRASAREASFKKSAPATAIISIVDVLAEPNRFCHAPWIKGILRLCFEDVEESEPDCITDQDALRIRDFVLKMKVAGVERLIVHCEAGVSRSAGVAAAILKSLGADETRIWNDSKYSPNRACYEKVLKAFADDSQA